MYLKQIELQGFKSFPDRTKMVFEPGATIIIGPNGSGKSNISDAMRWVLGEISSKSLRGAKMEDIIFGGSDSRKPMNYAEVSVTFDNKTENGRLDVPYDEICVTRRYHRNGDSEYFVNRKEVRLRDIYEMFMNTGIGRDGYSIISQGRVAEIISRKSDERRGIFEDAAGIAKYRHRKNEAERKLEATTGNMDRVGDIISVMSGHLASLERESIKAKRFIEYSEIKQKADVQLWLFDTEKLRTDIAASETDLRHTDLELGEAAEAVETLAAQQERLESLSSQNKAEAARLFDQIRARTRENYELDTDIKVAKTRIEHMEAAAEADRKAAADLRAEAQGQRDEAAAKQAEAEKLAAGVEELSAQEALERAAAGEAEKKAEQLEDAVAAAFDDLSEARAELSDIQARLELLGRSSDEDVDRDRAARRDLEDRERTLAQHEAQCSESRYSIAEYDAKLASGGVKLEAKKKQAGQTRQKHDDSVNRLNELRVRINTLSGRIDALKRMEEHFEGYNNGVRHVMNAYREGRVRGGSARCGTIYGPLSSLIQVESRYVTAIETALGGAIQNVVVDNEETARAAIETLKRDSAGRATFFPLTSVRPAGNPGRELSDAAGFPGYVGVASELVRTDDRFSGIVSSMLGRIAVFDDLEHATVMEKKCRYSVRVVTLDGQQINRDGSFTGGSVRTGSGILTRADEIKRMSAELESSRASAQKLENEIAELARTLEALDGGIALDEGELKLLDTLRAVEAAKLEKQQETLESDRRLLEKFRADLESVTGEKERRETEMSSLEIRKKELDKKVGELDAFRLEKDAAREACTALKEEKQAAVVRLTVRVSEVRRDIESCGAMAALALEKAARLDADALAKDETVRTQTGEAAALKKELEDALTRFTAGEAELEKLNAERGKAESGGLEMERRLTGLRRAAQERQARKDELMQIKMRYETSLAALRSQLDTLSQKFWEEHNMTRAEALAFNYPPITAADRPAVMTIQTDYRNKIRNIGTCNPAAIDEYAAEKAKYDELTAQMSDLMKSRGELEKIIVQLEGEMKKAFADSFNQINENFKLTFHELFGGGSAELLLTDPENVLESGIEIKAAPPGKIVKSLLQLSGGEQSFVAIALFFAILKVNPTPFCILDEIEAALDEVNVERFAQYIRRYSDGTQFIIITHRRGTMNAADRLYGVTMPESGISKILAVDINEIADKAGKGGLFDELS